MRRLLRTRCYLLSKQLKEKQFQNLFTILFHKLFRRVRNEAIINQELHELQSWSKLSNNIGRYSKIWERGGTICDHLMSLLGCNVFFLRRDSILLLRSKGNVNMQNSFFFCVNTSLYVIRSEFSQQIQEVPGTSVNSETAKM